MGFEWITLNKSCAVCLALEGYHDEEPARPHPMCDCDIFEEDDGLPPGTCWGEITLGADLYVNGVMTIPVRVYKICPNGDQVSDYFVMESSFEDWYEAFIEDDYEAWSDWHDDMHAQIHAMCERELEYRCTTFVDPTP